ncbi:MAG: CoB--CoM heterodisulfide reductase iron-sulfur subunit B family protein [Thermodesulfobacteriota bacterium]
MRVGYYPGCSLDSSAREMGESFWDLLQGIGVEGVELDDWNCCGSSPAHSTHHGWALKLAMRNLLLAEEQGLGELLVMCPSCFVRLREGARTVQGDEQKAGEVKETFGRHYGGSVRLRFFLEVLRDLGLEALRGMVKRPLEGVRGALYYGCLLSRPEWITGFDVGPYEGFLEELFRSLGGEVVHWGYSRQCCGAHLGVTKPGLVSNLVDRIREHARRAGSNCLVVFCPLCQMNLEMRGQRETPLPVLYITELMGLAAELPKAPGWMARHLVDPRPMLRSLKIL